MMAVCHTVIPDRDEKIGEVIQYHAASPGKPHVRPGLALRVEPRVPTLMTLLRLQTSARWWRARRSSASSSRRGRRTRS